MCMTQRTPVKTANARAMMNAIVIWPHQCNGSWFREAYRWLCLAIGDFLSQNHGADRAEAGVGRTNGWEKGPRRTPQTWGPMMQLQVVRVAQAQMVYSTKYGWLK